YADFLSWLGLLAIRSQRRGSHCARDSRVARVATSSWLFHRRARERCDSPRRELPEADAAERWKLDPTVVRQPARARPREPNVPELTRPGCARGDPGRKERMRRRLAMAPRGAESGRRLGRRTGRRIVD